MSNVEPVVEGFDKENYLLLATDVSDEQAVKDMIEKTVEHFGQIDVLVN
ncbi:SDR family oxidoreductase, partial [Mesonia mobilis]